MPVINNAPIMAGSIKLVIQISNSANTTSAVCMVNHFAIKIPTAPRKANSGAAKVGTAASV